MQKTIAILANSYAGSGAELVASALAGGFVNRGYQVQLLAIEDNSLSIPDGMSVDIIGGGLSHDSPGWLKLTGLLQAARELKKLVKSRNIDLVQSHTYRSNYVNLLARILGSPHLVQIVNHGIASRYKTQGFLGKINLRLIKWLYPKADSLICPSKGMLEDLYELGLRQSPARIIPNPFDLGVLRQKAKVNDGTDTTWPDSCKHRFVFLGRLETVKRVDLILRAFAEAQKKAGQIHLKIVGTGEQRLLLEKLAAKLGLDQNVEFLGRKSNPFPVLASAQTLILFSEFEGFGNVLVEAMALETSVISANCPYGPGEILLSEGQCFGTLVQSGSLEGLVDAIFHHATGPKEEKIFRPEFLSDRADDFDSEKILDSYSESLNEIFICHK